MISTQRATGSLFGEIRSRTPSWSTSAAVPGVEPSPASRSRSNTSVGRRPGDVAHVRDLHRRIRVQMQLRRDLLGEPQPVLVVLEPPVRDGFPTGCTARSRRNRPRRAIRAGELLLRVLVGVRRALPLPEPAERAADHAHVRDVDVAVDDERDRLARQLGAQLISGRAHLLDHLGAALGEQRGQLLGAERSPGRPTLDRAAGDVRPDPDSRAGRCRDAG